MIRVFNRELWRRRWMCPVIKVRKTLLQSQVKGAAVVHNVKMRRQIRARNWQSDFWNRQLMVASSGVFFGTEIFYIVAVKTYVKFAIWRILGQSKSIKGHLWCRLSHKPFNMDFCSIFSSSNRDFFREVPGSLNKTLTFVQMFSLQFIFPSSWPKFFSCSFITPRKYSHLPTNLYFLYKLPKFIVMYWNWNHSFENWFKFYFVKTSLVYCNTK